MTVIIGNQFCTNVVVSLYRNLSCTAPPGPGIGDVRLVVTTTGSGSGSEPFAYNPPVVLAVVGTPCDAELSCSIQVCRACRQGGPQGATVVLDGGTRSTTDGMSPLPVSSDGPGPRKRSWLEDWPRTGGVHRYWASSVLQHVKAVRSHHDAFLPCSAQAPRAVCLLSRDPSSLPLPPHPTVSSQATPHVNNRSSGTRAPCSAARRPTQLEVSPLLCT
jgi:hypothetical protein